MKFKLVILLCLILQGCIVVRVPNKEARASRKMEKALNLVTDITTEYPNLVDSVRDPINVRVDIDGASDSVRVEPDSAAIADFFTKKYDPLVKTRDSLINILDNELADYESQLAAFKALEETDKKLAKTRQTVVKEIYPDTTLSLKITAPLIINGDTSEIDVIGLVSISESGVVHLKVTLPSQTIEQEIENTTPIFTVVKKLPWYVWFGVGLGLLLVVMAFLPRK